MQCPRCSTRWRVADSSATDNPVFKCGRCHHVFPQFPGAPPAAERGGARTRGTPPELDNLEFIFPQRGPGEHDDTAPPDLVDAIAPLRVIVGQDPPTAAPSAPAPAPRTSTSRAVPNEPPPVVNVAPVDAADPEPSFDLAPGDEDDIAFVNDIAETTDIGDIAPAAFRTLDVEAMMGASARTPAFFPATRLLLSFVALFALLALLARANPERTDALLARVPVLGAVLTAERLLGGRITLDDVQGGYQRLRSGRRVFVISGKATNNALVPVERIEVEGALYAASGNVDRKVISTGNKTTLKLRDLNESEIALLQNLNTRQPVAPGARVDFAIVFLEPPRDLREFSSRVLTARSTGRAPGPPGRQQSQPSVG